MKSVRWIITPLVLFLLCVAVITAVLVLSPTAREVTVESLQLVFAIVTTPFILETLSAALFLLGLLAYNRWRMHKEGDGWVYLMTQETTVPGTATRQVHSMILPTKPEPVNTDEDEAGVIEGYLELGLAAQALEELNRVDDPDLAQTLDITLLRIRVLAANLDTDAALSLLRKTAADHPQALAQLAVNAEQTAAWMQEHLPSHPDESRLWQEEARKLRQA